MPFTLAHPAAVLPLRRSRLAFSALLVGSMAPDFEYFFDLTRPVSHAMPGIVTFTFPLALAVLLIFQILVKWPLIVLLPHGLQVRVIGPARRFRWLPAPQFLLILLSLAIGIATHILWDGFTHRDGWMVVRWATLREPVSVFGHLWPMYALLQFGCTVFGMVVLAICFAAWYRRATTEDVVLRPQFSPAMKCAILCAMLATAMLLGVVNGGEWYGRLLKGASQHARFVVGFAITTTTVGIIELCGFSLICRAFRIMPREGVPESVKD